MFVLTADGLNLVNLDQYEEIMVGSDGTIFARGASWKATTIGRYESEERAKQVLFYLTRIIKAGVKLIEIPEK
jgi:hypothetical protein